MRRARGARMLEKRTFERSDPPRAARNVTSNIMLLLTLPRRAAAPAE